MSGARGAKLDWFRVLFAVLVVAIHTDPLETVFPVGNLILTRIIARVAVPFFFMATGYFLRDALEEGGLGRTLKKLCLYDLAAMALYLPLNFYSGDFQNLTVGGFLRDVFLDGTFYHLWYFPAVILGVLLVRECVRVLGWRRTGIVVAVLYGIGLGGDSWYGLAVRVPGVQAVYDWLFSWMDQTRNGLFFAPMYLWLGGSLTRWRPDRSAWGVGLLLSGCVLLAESLLLHQAQVCRFDSMYLALVPVCLCLFGLLTTGNTGNCKALRIFSLLIYVVHPWCIVVLRAGGRFLGLWGLLVENRVAHYLLVCLLSMVLSAAGTAIWMRLWPGKSRPETVPARAWLEIDRVALAHNAMALERRLPQGCELMAVVKADGYGHGALPVAQTLTHAGVRAFAVATLDEGIALRRGGIRGEILILGETPAQAAKQLKRYDLIQTVVDSAHAQSLENAGIRIRVHLAVDTGMHRLGIPAWDIDAMERVFQSPNLRVEGMFSHLCAADSDEEGDMAFTQGQIDAFFLAVEALKARGLDPGKLHLQASSGILRWQGLCCDYARAGIALYGVASGGEPLPEDLRPVLTLRARVASVRDLLPGDSAGYGRAYCPDTPRRIAAVTIGYADGVSRCYAQGGQVLLHSRRVPIVGRICMDQLLIDVTDVPETGPGDVVTLLGQDGDDSITAMEMARVCGTITNEILSRLHVREQ